jgi:hypothetical protein
LTNDTDKDVKSYFCSSSSDNNCDRTSLPSYSDLIENKENQLQQQHQSDQLNNPNLSIELANSNFLYNYNELTKMDTSNNSNNATKNSTNDETSSNETSNKKLIFGDDGGRVEQDDEEDDDDDEDEVIDKTRINQLKIVNLENDLDDEMEHEDNSAPTTATSQNLLTNSDELNLDNKNKIVLNDNTSSGGAESLNINSSINSSNNKSSDSSTV